MILTLNDFDISQIAGSGQCFRMQQLAPGLFSVIALDHYLEIRVLEGDRSFRFSCGKQEFERFWRPYFDLDFDYDLVKRSIPADDAYLQRAAAAGGGIRILRQDLWETLVSFLISQQNNIPRIRLCIRLLCEAYGEPLAVPEGRAAAFSFPAPEAMAGAGEEELRRCNLGYRAKYVLRAARAVAGGSVDLEALKELDYPAARETLMGFYGIGAKVADCICLFALHHIEAFPVDTHIRQVLEREYPQGCPFPAHSPYAGILQQYMFYYELIRGK